MANAKLETVFTYMQIYYIENRNEKNIPKQIWTQVVSYMPVDLID